MWHFHKGPLFSKLKYRESLANYCEPGALSRGWNSRPTICTVVLVAPATREVGGYCQQHVSGSQTCSRSTSMTSGTRNSIIQLIIYIYSHHFVMLVWQSSQPPVRVLATVPLKKQHLKAMPRDISENLWVASWQCSAAHELEHQVDWAWWSRQWSSWRQCRPEIEITGIQHSVKSYGARRARLNESVPR